jgi:hypothetical protein
MGFLDNTSITVDAVLTKKGRELLARGQNEFEITKFALADDEIDYNLWDVSHPNGSSYYGAVIENMPLLESFVDENQVMRFKLITLGKNTNKLPKMTLPMPTVTLPTGGQQVISPITNNSTLDDAVGYRFTIHNSDAAELLVETAGVDPETQQQVTFTSQTDSTKSVTINAKSAKLIGKNLNSQITTNLTIQGLGTGAIGNMSIVTQASGTTN